MDLLPEFFPTDFNEILGITLIENSQDRYYVVGLMKREGDNSNIWTLRQNTTHTTYFILLVSNVDFDGVMP